jgi:ketosteroid isomerase-like protein
MDEESIKQEILRQEQKRVEALISADVAALDGLIADDLVHIHADGKIDGKADYLHGVANKYKFHAVERGELRIRIYGDLAVVNGPLNQVLSVSGTDKQHKISAVVTQVWVRVADGWKQNTCHMAFLSVS